MTIRSQVSAALLTVLASLPLSISAKAQSNITSDTTLGGESSQVIPNFSGEPAEVIFGGAVREQNLFHSFEEFNVDAGRFAFFFVPEGVDNVLSRVTGRNPSNIQGVLGTVGGVDPNLYLINPNGIIFGPNARLAVDGAFVATTAEGIQLGEEGRFSTVDPDDLSLLTVNPSALLFGSRSGDILSQGFLTVEEGKSLILAGGAVDIDGGALSVRFENGENVEIGAVAEGGNVGVGAVAEAGTVELLESNGVLSLSFPENLARADVSLENTLLQAASTGSGGNVSVTGRNIDVLGSRLQAGIVQRTGSAESTAGDIDVDASERLSLSSTGVAQSSISNVIFQDAQGNAGNITLLAEDVSASGAVVTASTFGRGDAGNISLQAENVTVGATNIFSVVWDEGEGSAGDITLDVSNIVLSSGSQISASSFGQGRTGNVVVNAENSVLLKDSLTTIFSALFGSASERGGDILISTKDLSLTNGAQLSTSLSGSGEVGDVIIDAENSVSLDGFPTAIISSLSDGAIGKGGDIRITTRDLSLTNSAELDASLFGSGEGGDVVIDAENSVTIDGGMPVPGRIGSSIFSTVEETGKGPSGNIDITTDSLFVTNGGNIQTLVRGQGNAGNISIRARDSVLVDGSFFREETTLPGFDGVVRVFVVSVISSAVTNEETADGNGGDIYIQAGESITLSNSGKVRSGIDKREAVGDAGGTVTVDTANLTLEGGAEISAQSFGSGVAGDIVLDVSEVLQLIDSDIQTTAIASSGGDILINTAEGSESGLTILRGDADILTESLGDGGDITLRGAAVIALDDSDIVARSQSATGGNITLNNFFSEDIPPDNQPPFDGDGRVDVNADGQVAAGVISSPDTSFLENSLSALPDTILDTEQLVSGSCIVRENDGSRFAVIGRSRLSARPVDALGATYLTGTVRSVAEDVPASNLQVNTLPVEPQGIYSLPDGRKLLSHECS